LCWCKANLVQHHRPQFSRQARLEKAPYDRYAI
jgi:hypothetical protein